MIAIIRLLDLCIQVIEIDGHPVYFVPVPTTCPLGEEASRVNF
jgi:hypothetical protein